MDNMYVNISEGGIITDITNNKSIDNKIYVGVKYILGRDNIVFSSTGEGILYVERIRGNKLIYKYEFEEAGDYMITPLFVDKYKSNHPILRDIYAFLKRNFKGKFYLEENNKIDKEYEIIFSSWIDVQFDYKFKISVNTEKITEIDLFIMREQLMTMKEMNLFKLHDNINGKSIFIDDNSIGIMKTINSLFEHDTHTISQ